MTQQGHLLTTPRRWVYLWCTWLTPLLAGDASCEWAIWFKGHYQFLKLERDGFDLAAWKVRHAEMVEARAELLRADGWTVYVEDQNKFNLKGRSAIVGGKPDIFATRGTIDALVVDCKGGKRRASDLQQVLIYMLGLPLAFPGALTGRALAGEVQYRDGSVEIPPDAFTPALRARIVETIRRMGLAESPRRVPSARECAYCDIGPSDCPDRIESPEAMAAVPAELW